MVKEDKILFLELTYYNYKINETTGKWEFQFYYKPPIKRCKDFSDYKEKENIFGISLFSWYCLDFNNFTKAGGGWDGNFVYGMAINTRQCINSTENDYTCKSKEESDELFKSENIVSNLYFSYIYEAVIPSMSDYEEPIKRSLVAKYELLSKMMFKKNNQYFKSVSIEDDRGWIFPSKTKNTFLSNDYIRPDVLTKDPQTDSSLFAYILYFSKTEDTYSRSYTKIQEVFAVIGGFAKFFFVILQLSYNFIYQFYIDKSIYFKLNNLNFDTSKGQKQVDDSKLRKSSLISLNRKENHDLNKQKIDSRKFKWSDYVCRWKKTKMIQNIQSLTRNSMDVCAYIRHMSELNIIKESLLNKHQQSALKFCSLNIKDLHAKNQVNKEEIVKYFNQSASSLQSNDHQALMNKTIIKYLQEEISSKLHLSDSHSAVLMLKK